MSSAASLLLWVIQFWWNLQFICVCVTCSVCFSGLTYLVFPGAVHTRFEHSLGVYKLAGEAMNNLQKYQVCTIVHCLDWYILTSDSLLSNGEAYAFFFHSTGKRAWHWPCWCANCETCRLVFSTMAPQVLLVNDLCDNSVQVSYMTSDMAPSVICLSMSFFLVFIQDQHGDSLCIYAVDYYYFLNCQLFCTFISTCFVPIMLTLKCN